MSMSEIFYVLFHCNRISATENTELLSLSPDPEAKSSSEITNLTLSTVSYEYFLVYFSVILFFIYAGSSLHFLVPY